MASSDPNKRPKPGQWPPPPESSALPPSTWAKRTGFQPKFSGETNASNSGQIPKPREAAPTPDLEAGRARPPLPPPAPAAAQPTANGVHQSSNGAGGRAVATPGAEKDQSVKRRRDAEASAPKPSTGPVNGGRQQGDATGDHSAPARRRTRSEEVVDVVPQPPGDDDDELMARHAHMKYEIRDTPGLVPIGFYGVQHYISMLGSLILIPLVIVPIMGGSYEDTANVVSTVLFVSGATTILHTFFGTRLPLIQGPSFVYLAPALAVINSPEFLKLNGDNFKHIMRELQGAIIIGSAFQAFLGYSGLMSLFLRLIHPVVVAPTVAAVGLSFYSYGFPQVGNCLEIGAVQILLVIIFALYLRKVSIFGHRVFLIYAVPLGLAITWAAAFLLTETGAYSYKGCDVNMPTSNMSEHCRKHVLRMKQCRADTSHALRSAPWFRFPYPLQWGTPIFNWKMALVMCVVSTIASVDSLKLYWSSNADARSLTYILKGLTVFPSYQGSPGPTYSSVGSYHASSLLVASRPPTPGVLSRGIGMEGLTSILAGLWGTGTGSTTLTENIHTIAVTKMGSRRAVELGACVLILLSLIGKVGGFLASIPQVIVAALLCFMWAMLTALGLSNLRYSEAGSSRNIIIVGLSLFFSLSIPAYFQQYGISPNSNVSVPIYLQPYIVASHGPINTKYGGLNYFLNTILSFHMVIAFLMAVILDNTVPGSRQERGVYVWTEAEAARREPAVSKDYGLPYRVSRVFRWVKWVGL